MRLRVKGLVCVVAAGAVVSLCAARGSTGRAWAHFFVYLLAIVLSSGMKVGLPKREATMGVNFPFIFLGIVQLSPPQAIALAVASVIVQCRIRVIKPFSIVQIFFNVANVTTATALACWTYTLGLKLMHQEVAPALGVAATAYFLANTIPLAMVLGWDSEIPVVTQWVQEFPWYFPFYLVGAILAATANYVGILFGWLTSMLLIPMVYTVYRAYCAQMAIIRDRERHIEETEALHLRTIEGLAMAIEAKDKNTHRHLMRVRVYVSQLGKMMGLDDAQMRALVTASFLHDIGKLAVPEHIINKPGKLNREEFEKMKIHPVVGADILERVRFPYPVVPIVRAHHEAWDGSGYPDGLKGEEIPIGARILTAVDFFDALASQRPYRRALPLDEAMAMVKSKAGIQLDPAVVSLLEQHYSELEKLANQQIEEMAPLDTDVSIERGAAPGAGYEEQSAPSSGEQTEVIAALNELLRASPSNLEASAILSSHLQLLIPFDCLAVYLKAGEWLVPQYVDGRFAEAFSPLPIPVGEGLSGWAAENGRPIVNGNPTVELNFVAGSSSFTADGSALSIPIFDPEGSVMGVVTVYSSKPAAFSKDHLRIFEAIQSNFSLTLGNALSLRSCGAGLSMNQASQPPEGVPQR